MRGRTARTGWEMITCRACGGPVSIEAVACPKCGQPTPKTEKKDFNNLVVWWLALGVIALLALDAVGIIRL